MFYVGGNADDRQGRKFGGRKLDRFSDGVFPWIELVRQRFADDRHGLRFGGVRIEKRAAAQDWRPDRGEIAGRGDRVGSNGTMAEVFIQRAARNCKRGRLLSAAHGHGTSNASGLDSRNIIQAAENLAINACDTIFVRIARAGKRKFKHENTAGIEAGIDLEQMEKCADEQAGGDDKDERERNFGDEQRAADFLATRSGARALSAFFQGFDEIFARGTERGGESEEQSGEQRDGQRERKYAG